MRTSSTTIGTPLCSWPIQGGHVGIAQELLIGGADHNRRGSKDDYPIHLAASRGEDEVVLALVQRGADMIQNCHNIYERRARTPLAVAVLEDRVSTVGELLAGGADVNVRMGRHRRTAKHVAAGCDKIASIPALVEAGADIEARDKGEWTTLHSSAVNGSCAATLALLHLGANVNAKSKGGRIPLHYACSWANADAADLLLRWGADESMLDNCGITPSQMIPDVAEASEQPRLRIERLTKLLAHAPQDRAWRRRGFMVMCRANPDRLRLVVETPNTAAGATGQQPQQRPNRRARSGQVKVEVQMDGAHGGGKRGGTGSSSNVRGRGGAGGEGVGGGFDGVATWLMSVTDEGVFRSIMGFL